MPSRPAAVSIKEVIQELYKAAWKTFGQFKKKEPELYKQWFDKFRVYIFFKQLIF